MWGVALRDTCAGNQGGIPKYCGSRRFKCLVRDRVILTGDAIDPQFANADCSPGASNVVSVSNSSTGLAIRPVSRSAVEFTPSDLVDAYTVVVTTIDDGVSTRTPVDVRRLNLDGRQNLSTVVTVPVCRDVEIAIETRYRNQLTTGSAQKTRTAGCTLMRPVISGPAP